MKFLANYDEIKKTAKLRIPPTLTPEEKEKEAFDKLPSEAGHYVWSELDLYYLHIGLVQVMEDTPEHIAHLKTEEKLRPNDCKFYIYEKNGKTLTMYHECLDERLPSLDKNRRPIVDGYRKVEFDDLLPLKESRK